MTYYQINELKPYSDWFEKTENFSILANRFIPFSEKLDQPEVLKTRHQERLKKDSSYFQSICDTMISRQAQTLAALTAENYICIYFSMKTVGRFIPGMGTAHINENGMALDHIYGLPYLRGSACKGITRQWAIQFLAEGVDETGELDLNFMEKLIDLEEADLKKLFVQKDPSQLIQKTKHKISKTDYHELPELTARRIYSEENFKETLDLVRTIFGSQEREGKVIFLDAYPVRLSTDICIMTSHNPQYYGEAPDKASHWPSDSDDPLPVPFLTVKEGALFAFGLASRSQVLLQQAVTWLFKALQILGAGAKTSAGYGYFTYTEMLTEKIKKAMKLIY